jgi:hypothetical protein
MHSAWDLVQFEHLGSCLSHFIFRLAHSRHECLCGGGAGGGEDMVDGGVVCLMVSLEMSETFSNTAERSARDFPTSSATLGDLVFIFDTFVNGIKGMTRILISRLLS